MTGLSGASGIDGDGAGPPHHLGATGGATGFTTGGVTPVSARGGGFGLHGAVGGGGDEFLASSYGHGTDRPSLPCYFNK